MHCQHNVINLSFCKLNRLQRSWDMTYSRAICEYMSRHHHCDDSTQCVSKCQRKGTPLWCWSYIHCSKILRVQNSPSDSVQQQQKKTSLKKTPKTQVSVNNTGWAHMKLLNWPIIFTNWHMWNKSQRARLPSDSLSAMETLGVLCCSWLNHKHALMHCNGDVWQGSI